MNLRFVKLVYAGAFGAAALTICSEAQGFFPPVDPNPGAVVVTPPATNPIIPTTPTTPTATAVSPPPPNPVRPSTTNTICPTRTAKKPPYQHRPKRPADPCVVPEPATVISGLLGLGAIGLAAARRRKKTSGSADTATAANEPTQ